MLFMLLVVSMILFVSMPSVNANPEYEDFNTYTEVDPNSHITVTNSTHIDFNMYGDEDAYVYSEKAFTGDFEHMVDAIYDHSPPLSLRTTFWALTNEVDDLKGLEDAGKSVICVYFTIGGAPSYPEQVYLEESYAGTEYTDYANISASTWYYFTVSRSNYTLTLEVYNNSARTNDYLEHTLSLTLHFIVEYRYIFAALTYNQANGNHGDCQVMNLDLQYTYQYTFYGLYDELSGDRAGAVNVTAYYGAAPSWTFEVDGSFLYGSYTMPQYFHFELGTNDREYWLSSGETSATIYIFNDTTTEYRFEFLDLSGALQEYPNVRAEFYVNTTLHTIEKRGVDIEDKVMFSLVNGRRYKISIEDTTVGYTFGDLLMTDTTTVSLTLKGIEFPQNVILAYRYVRLYAERHNNYSSISMLYEDTQTNTDNVVCNIKYQNGSVAYTTTQYADSFNVTWTSANYSLTYYVEMDATHDDYGTLNYRAIMYRGGFNTSPWGIDWIGTIPDMASSALIPVFLILACAGVFSKVNAYMGAFAATTMGILFVWWGWIDIAPGLLITALVFSILMALGYKKRVVIGA